MENRQLLEKIYGKNIVNMLQKKYFEIVENPDFVVEGAGDYCGDRLVFRVRLIKKRIEIEYESYSCAIVEASMFLMFDMLKEKSVIEQRTVCENILSKIEEGDVSIFTDIFNIQEILYRRKDCLILPWKLMNKVIETAIKIEPEFRDQPQIVRGNSLDCEACVSANYINTSTVNKENNRNSNLNVLLSIIDTPDKDLNYIENKLRKQLKFAPRRLGKIVLLEKEKIGLKKLVENWDDDYVIFFARNKTANILGKHIIENFSHDIPYDLQKQIEKETKKRNVIQDIFSKVEKRLRENSIVFYPIKGIATSNFYKNVQRYYGDMDILVPDIKTFFEVAEIMRNEFKFDYCHELGKSCSVKCFNNNVISGHGHLERLIDNELITLDIGYPCIPADNNRIIDIGSFKTHYMSNLFIIALAHAFKHARPPIKDINDCYLLVEKQLIDYDYITEFVKKNKMEIKYYALCKILIEYYDVHSTMLKNFQKIQEILSLKDKVIVHNLIKLGWPFTKITQRLFQYNLKRSSDKMAKKVLDVSINPFFNTTKRVYMIPIVKAKNVSLKYENIESVIYKFDENYKVIANGVYGIIINSQKYIVVNHCVFVCQEWFDVDTMIPLTWIDIATKIMSEINEQYRICLHYDENKKHWIYK